MKNQKVTCPSCKNKFENKPKLSLIGFRKFSCPSCNNNFIYPMTTTYVTIYYFLIVIFTIIFISSLIRGDIAIPGLLVIAGIIGLIKNNSLKKELKSKDIDYDIK